MILRKAEKIKAGQDIMYRGHVVHVLSSGPYYFKSENILGFFIEFNLENKLIHLELEIDDLVELFFW
jgi:hypothetical protein